MAQTGQSSEYNWTLVNKWAVIDNADVRFALEEFRSGEQQMMLVHLKLKAAHSPKLLKWMLNTWRVFTKHVTCPLFTFNENEDEKWRHFISLFGFKPFTEIIWSDGTRRRLYWHDNERILTNPKYKLQHKIEHDLRIDNEPGSVPDTVSDASVLGRDEQSGASLI